MNRDSKGIVLDNGYSYCYVERMNTPFYKVVNIVTTIITAVKRLKLTRLVAA